MDRDLVKRSRFLSLVLRHEPQRIGLELDPQGWARIDDLIEKTGGHGQPLDRDLLGRIVAEDDKQRFALSEDGLRIRANQGHSVDIDLALAPQPPPDRLYHGTAGKNLPSIQATGLNAGSRRHVHLSTDTTTAIKVGQRHGTPVVLAIASDRMYAAGHVFYRSENGVWLTEAVPVPFIRFPAT